MVVLMIGCRCTKVVAGFSISSALLCRCYNRIRAGGHTQVSDYRWLWLRQVMTKMLKGMKCQVRVVIAFVYWLINYNRYCGKIKQVLTFNIKIKANILRAYNSSQNKLTMRQKYSYKRSFASWKRLNRNFNKETYTVNVSAKGKI